MHDRYNNFAALRASEPAGAFSIAVCDRASHVVVAAPHGGGIEPGTSEIVVAIAGADLSYYLFEGHKRQGNAALHITSSNFDEPEALALLRRAACVLTVHGEASEAETVYLGGLNASLKLALTRGLESRGYAVRENAHLQGLDERNICNMGLTGQGVQLELSAGLRRTFFESLSRAGRTKPTARLAEFSAIVRETVH
jgi:phage replication-related protein YjqB (UPF0714/DUF867 family)